MDDAPDKTKTPDDPPADGEGGGGTAPPERETAPESPPAAPEAAPEPGAAPGDSGDKDVPAQPDQKGSSV